MLNQESNKKSLIIRIWGMIPMLILVILCICIAWMYQNVQAKKAHLEAEKAAQLKNEQ
ncbi:secreted protein, partial [Candidatus Magnetomorum sp. HK-1]